MARIKAPSLALIEFSEFIGFTFFGQNGFCKMQIFFGFNDQTVFEIDFIYLTGNPPAIQSKIDLRNPPTQSRLVAEKAVLVDQTGSTGSTKHLMRSSCYNKNHNMIFALSNPESG